MNTVSALWVAVGLIRRHGLTKAHVIVTRWNRMKEYKRKRDQNGRILMRWITDALAEHLATHKDAENVCVTFTFRPESPASPPPRVA